LLTPLLVAAILAVIGFIAAWRLLNREETDRSPVASIQTSNRHGAATPTCERRNERSGPCMISKREIVGQWSAVFLVRTAIVDPHDGGRLVDLSFARIVRGRERRFRDRRMEQDARLTQINAIGPRCR
jgi:hypothetical protein